MRRAIRKKRANTEAGLALPATVWAALVLFLITAAILNLTLSQRRQVAAEETLLAMNLAAESGLNSTIKALIDDRTAKKEAIVGSAKPYSFSGYNVSVLVEAEAGKINLNFADVDLIASLLVEAGLSRNEAGSLADSIDEYRSQEHPFRTLNEVLKARGMDIALFEDMKPDITLYSDGPGVRGEFASPRVLKALAAAGAEFTPSGPSVLKPAEFETGTTWRLTVTVTGGEGRLKTLTWIIRLTGDPDKPYLVHWMG